MDCDFVLPIDAPGGFVVFDRFVIAAHALEDRRRVEPPRQFAASACKTLVSIVKLSQAAKRQRQVVQNAFVLRREFRGSLQTINRGSIVSVLVKREAEIVER